MPATNFERIAISPDQMAGVPCIRGLRIPVATALRMRASGMSEQEILARYPDFQVEDVREYLRFAAVSAMERDLSRVKFLIGNALSPDVAWAPAGRGPRFQLR